MSDKERLERAERQLRLWGIDKLTTAGVKHWTEEIKWLIQQADKVKQLNSEVLEWKFALDETTFDKNRYEQTVKEIETKAQLYNEKGWALNGDVILEIIRKSTEVI